MRVPLLSMLSLAMTATSAAAADTPDYALTVYSANMFGDALRDILDPRLRGTR